MKATEIRELSIEEIDEKILKAKKELFNLRVQSKTGKLENKIKLRKIRRDIARMNTIQKELIKKS